MNHCHNSPIPFNRLAVFVGLAALHGLAGCNSAGEALPTATDVPVKHDAGVKRGTGGAAGTGGAGGATVAIGTGGGGGATDIGGTGGSTTVVPDAAFPRDAVPELAQDAVRDVPPVLDAGGIAIEVSIAVDTAIDVSRDLVKQDLGPPDAPSEGPGDSTADTQDSAPEALSDVPPDIVPDTPGDLLDVPADLSDLGGPELPNLDVPPDVFSGPTCTNPGWAKQFAFPSATTGWLSGDKEGNLFLASTLFNSIDLGGSVGTLTSTGDADSAIVRFDPATGNAVWAMHFGDNAAQTAIGAAVDSSGHVGFIGAYQGTMIVGPSTLANTATWPDGYIGVVDGANGTGLGAISVALQDANTTTTSQKLTAIAANPNVDGFVVCGSSAILATDLVTNPAATAGGGLDIVVAKVTVTGSGLAVSWARQIGGTGGQTCSAAAVDDSGNVVIAGTYFGQLDFGGGAFSPAGADGRLTVPWIARLSGTDGSTVAAVNVPPAATGNLSSTVSAVAVDSSGNVAMAGFFTKPLAFGSTALTPAVSGHDDAFVAKFSTSLSAVWAKSWGNPSDPKTQSFAYGTAFDSSGNVTLTGNFNGSITIGPSGGILTAATGVDPTTGGQTDNADIFVAHLTGADGTTQCAARFGDYAGQTASGVFIARSATGPAKDVPFFSGTLTSTLDFRTVSLSTIAATTTDYWIARF